MSKKYHIFKRPNKNINVNVEEKILPSNSSNLLGPQVPKYIVIHEVSLGTGKSPSEYNMEHYYKKIYDADSLAVLLVTIIWLVIIAYIILYLII